MTAGPYIGEISALITALAFAFTATIFTFAGRMVGSEMVNRTRLLIALILLVLIHQVLYGLPAPLNAAGDRWLWLGLSGIIGLALGDAFLFQSYLMIGPRLGMLLMSLSPVMAALMSRWFLGEVLGTNQMIGIGVTVIGVAWVVSDRPPNSAAGGPPALNPDIHPVRRMDQMRTAIQDNRTFLLGLLLGLMGAVGQSVGAVLAKKGLYGDFAPISGNIIRLAAATVFIWAYYGLRGKIPETIEKLRLHPRSRLLLLGGAITGPVVGVSFSMLAIQRTAVGVASTLMATTPVFMLPVGYFIFKERFGWKSIAGTVVAILGVGLLFSS